MRPRFFTIGHFVLVFSIFLSTPARAGWTALPNAPVAPRHDDVFFVDPELGWVVNGRGEIHRTTDGGDSWEPQLDDPLHYFRSVGFADAQRGWVGSLDGLPLLYATTDGGGSWAPVLNIPAPQPGGICGISVVNASVVYACGRYDGSAVVIKTTDGGANWTSMDLSANGLAHSLVDIFFFDAMNGFVVGGVGSNFNTRRAVILATTNGGATWETRHTTARNTEFCWKISFSTANDGFVSIERFNGPDHFLKTTNGGQTWTDHFFHDDYEEQGIGFVTPGLGWIGGYGGPTYESTDGGASWHLAGFGMLINRFRFLGEGLGYAVGETVYKYTASTTGVAAAPVAPPGLALENHPNPFQHSTAIAYTLDRLTEVKMTIHDAQGRRVATLFDGLKPPGRHQLIWDARDDAGRRVSAGIYWYRLAIGERAAARKLLVIQ